MSRVLKDSGVEWIGKIPENWNMVYLKHLYSFEKGKNAALYTKEYVFDNSGEYPVYSGQTEDNGVMGNIKTYDYDMDECLFTTTVGAKVMTTKILSGKFSLSQNCLIMKRQAETNTHFNYYVLNALFDYEKSKIPSYMQPSLRIEDLKTYKYFIPPLLEQQKIADYLDKKCSKIDEQKANYEKSIELLKEYKQSLITKAVTKGINPNCKLKDSGIDWIGEIPKHWVIGKIKRVCNLKTGGTPDTKNEERFNGDLTWYTPGDFTEQYILNNSERTLSIKAKEDNVAVLVPGDTTLIVGIGATAGKIGYTEKEASFNQQITALLSNKIIGKYLMYRMIANTKFLRETALFTTLPILNNQTIGYYSLIYPKDISEQKQIADYLDKECSRIDKIISYREEKIEKLEEYKKSLIYECVTGKKEVL